MIVRHLILTIAKIIFLILGEGDTFGINGNFGKLEEKFSINFNKAKTKFCLCWHCNGENSYFFVNGKKAKSSKQTMKMSTLISLTVLIFQLIMMLLINLTCQKFKSI